MYAAILVIINNDAKLQQSPYNDGIYVCEIDSKEEEVGKGKEANINQSNTGCQFWKQRLRWMDGWILCRKLHYYGNYTKKPKNKYSQTKHYTLQARHVELCTISKYKILKIITKKY